MSGKTVAPFHDSSGICRKYTSSDYGSADVDLVAATKVKRLPRMISWDGGDLELGFADGTDIVFGSAQAGTIAMAPATINTAGTTATAVYVWW
jgi:hypothetical protein